MKESWEEDLALFRGEAEPKFSPGDRVAFSDAYFREFRNAIGDKKSITMTVLGYNRNMPWVVRVRRPPFTTRASKEWYVDGYAQSFLKHAEPEEEE